MTHIGTISALLKQRARTAVRRADRMPGVAPFHKRSPSGASAPGLTFDEALELVASAALADAAHSRAARAAHSVSDKMRFNILKAREKDKRVQARVKMPVFTIQKGDCE